MALTWNKSGVPIDIETPYWRKALFLGSPGPGARCVAPERPAEGVRFLQLGGRMEGYEVNHLDIQPHIRERRGDCVALFCIRVVDPDERLVGATRICDAALGGARDHEIFRECFLPEELEDLSLQVVHFSIGESDELDVGHCALLSVVYNNILIKKVKSH